MTNAFIRVDGKVLVNGTPHSLNFIDSTGTELVIPTSVPTGEKTGPWVIDAKATESPVGTDTDLVKTVFNGTSEGRRRITEIKAMFPDRTVRIIGSMIAAQAYPGEVFGMVPAPGFERVPPAQKRMTTLKFTTF